jgi:hypothetical protein
MLEILCSGHVEATIFTLMLRPRGGNNFFGSTACDENELLYDLGTIG